MKAKVFLTGLVWVTLLLTGIGAANVMAINQAKNQIINDIEEIENEAKYIKKQIKYIKDNHQIIRNRIDEINEFHQNVEEGIEILEEMELLTFEVTAYAPLDPAAIPGWDYCRASGPHATASGENVVPGVTIASGTQYPFGTKKYIEGVGIRTVMDRGGLIKNNNIDLAVNTKKEAREFGRRILRVIVF